MDQIKIDLKHFILDGNYNKVCDVLNYLKDNNILDYNTYIKLIYKGSPNLFTTALQACQYINNINHTNYRIVELLLNSYLIFSNQTTNLSEQLGYTLTINKFIFKIFMYDFANVNIEKSLVELLMQYHTDVRYEINDSYYINYIFTNYDVHTTSINAIDFAIITQQPFEIVNTMIVHDINVQRYIMHNILYTALVCNKPLFLELITVYDVNTEHFYGNNVLTEAIDKNDIISTMFLFKYTNFKLKNSDIEYAKDIGRPRIYKYLKEKRDKEIINLLVISKGKGVSKVDRLGSKVDPFVLKKLKEYM